MAETLGSLVDKLTIKSIREIYINKMIKEKKPKFSKRVLEKKLSILKKQKAALRKEIEEFVILAAHRKIMVRDDKLKLYNSPKVMNKIGKIPSISRGIEELTKKNLELWDLEDEARRKDIPLIFIGRIKKKIDIANQKRNDLIDRIDRLLEKKLQRGIKRP